MVPIKDAINSGSWLHCEKRNNLFEANQFRLKIKSFKKLSLKEIDEPDKIDFDSNGVLWLMKIEIVNLNKIPMQVYEGPYSLILVDQDDFVFPPLEDFHLTHGSKFSKSSGMDRFYYKTLLPKIKVVGSIIFQLPDDDDAEYFISLKDNGIVQEV